MALATLSARRAFGVAAIGLGQHLEIRITDGVGLDALLTMSSRIGSSALLFHMRITTGSLCSAAVPNSLMVNWMPYRRYDMAPSFCRRRILC
jgi:hypothetical protein